MCRSLVSILLIGVAINTTSAIKLAEDKGESMTVIEAVAPVFSNYQSAVPEDYRNVVIRVKVDNAGKVTTAESITGIDVNGKAKQAALRWRFSPAHPAHKGVERVAKLSFVFRNMPAEASDEELTSIFRSPFEIEVRRKVALLEKD